MKIYAGIGSRSTPPAVLAVMRLAAANGIALKNLALVSSDVVLREVLGENEPDSCDSYSQSQFWW